MTKPIRIIPPHERPYGVWTLLDLAQWLDEHAGEMTATRFRGRWTVEISGPRGKLLGRGLGDNWEDAVLRALRNHEAGVAP